MDNHEKVKKYIKLFGIIVLILFIILGIYFGYNKIVKNSKIKQNETNLKDYLQSIGFESEDDVYYKEEKTTNNDTVTTTNYIYNVNVNKFSKTIQANSKNSTEQLSLRYDGTDEITLEYSYTDYSNINKNRSINQSSIYNKKNNSFDCEVIFVEGDYPAQCNKMKTESEMFADEVNEILEKAKVDKNYIIKNSNKW